MRRIWRKKQQTDPAPADTPAASSPMSVRGHGWATDDAHLDAAPARANDAPPLKGHSGYLQKQCERRGPELVAEVVRSVLEGTPWLEASIRADCMRVLDPFNASGSDGLDGPPGIGNLASPELSLRIEDRRPVAVTVDGFGKEYPGQHSVRDIARLHILSAQQEVTAEAEAHFFARRTLKGRLEHALKHAERAIVGDGKAFTWAEKNWKLAWASEAAMERTDGKASARVARLAPEFARWRAVASAEITRQIQLQWVRALRAQVALVRDRFRSLCGQMSDPDSFCRPFTAKDLPDIAKYPHALREGWQPQHLQAALVGLPSFRRGFTPTDADYAVVNMTAVIHGVAEPTSAGSVSADGDLGVTRRLFSRVPATVEVLVHQPHRAGKLWPKVTTHDDRPSEGFDRFDHLRRIAELLERHVERIGGGSRHADLAAEATAADTAGQAHLASMRAEASGLREDVDALLAIRVEYWAPLECLRAAVDAPGPDAALEQAYVELARLARVTRREGLLSLVQSGAVAAEVPRRLERFMASLDARCDAYRVAWEAARGRFEGHATLLDLCWNALAASIETCRVRAGALSTLVRAFGEAAAVPELAAYRGVFGALYTDSSAVYEDLAELAVVIFSDPDSATTRRLKALLKLVPELREPLLDNPSLHPKLAKVVRGR